MLLTVHWAFLNGSFFKPFFLCKKKVSWKEQIFRTRLCYCTTKVFLFCCVFQGTPIFRNPNILCSSFVAIFDSQFSVHTQSVNTRRKKIIAKCKEETWSEKKEKHREIFNPISSFFLSILPSFGFSIIDWMEGDLQREEPKMLQNWEPFLEHLPRNRLLRFNLSFKCETTPETHWSKSGCRSKSFRRSSRRWRRRDSFSY